MKNIIITLLLLLPQATASQYKAIDKLNIRTTHVVEFLQENYPLALEAKKTHGIPVALFLGQMAIESGWGRDKKAVEDCNFFGIRLHGEYAVFDNKQQCIDVYTRTLTGRCYNEIQPHTLDDWFESLDSCNYLPSEKIPFIADVIGDFKLYKLD